MKWVSGMLAAVILSVVLVMVFSLFPLTDWQSSGWDFLSTDADTAVLQQHRPIVLQQDRVVDFLRAVPVRSAYRHVVLEEPRLLIDIEVDAPDERQIFHDALQILASAYTQTMNIDEVYLRFLTPDTSGRDLVLYVYSARDHRLIQQLQEGVTAEEYLPILEQFAHLQYGSGWSK